MKVLQTLGRHRAQEGVFQYKRIPAGVVIDSQIGTATLVPPSIVITSVEWQNLLGHLDTLPENSFRLSGTNRPEAPHQVLYAEIEVSIPARQDLRWNDSWKAYICAILEHEGSIDLYGGALGQGQPSVINLARDTHWP